MIILESTTVIASTLDGTTFLSMPVTKNRGIEISPYQRTLIHDDKFIVVLSVTVVSSVIILLTLVLTKLRCKTNNDIIYNTNGTTRLLTSLKFLSEISRLMSIWNLKK